MVNGRGRRPGVAGARGSGSRRLRTALACTSCRTRKTKCNGARPVCDVCEGLGFECLYKLSASGRASSASHANAQETHPSQIEARLAALEDMMLRSHDSGNTATEDPIPQRHGHDVQLQQYESPSQHSPTNAGGSDLPDVANGHEVVAVTPESEHGEDTVDGMGVVTFADESGSAVFGPTSNSVLLEYIAEALNKRAQFATATKTFRTESSDSALPVSRPASPRQTSQDGVSESRNSPSLNINPFVLPPQSTVSRLVKNFFNEIGLMFPYVNETAIMDEVAHLGANGLYGVRRSWLCLVNVMMAFSAYQSDNAGLQSQQSNGTEKTKNGHKTKDSDMYLARALSLLPNLTLKPANLEILQAVLVLTQYLQGTEFSASTWNFQRLSVQAAMQIGAHIVVPGKYSPLEQEIRNRCWHMCFILDRTCSMTFGRPPSIINDHEQVPLPIEHDFTILMARDVEMNSSISPAPSLTVTSYSQSIKLYRILGHIMERVYHNNYPTAQRISYDAVLANMVAQERQLAMWKAQIPLPLHVVSLDELASTVDASELSFSLSLVLTLRYLNARILLHRGMIELCFAQDREIIDSRVGNELDVYGRESIKIAVESASDLIGMISTLTEQSIKNLTTTWFLLYYVFNSAIVIFAADVLAAGSPSIPSFMTGDNTLLKLQMASHTLGKLGNQTRIAVRCRKYLKRLIEMASATVSVVTEPQFPLMGDALPGMRGPLAQGFESVLDLDSQILMPSDLDFLALAGDSFIL